MQRTVTRITLTNEKQKESYKSVTSQKKIFETLWKILFIVVTLVSAVLFKKIYVYQSSPEFESFRKGDIAKVVMFALPFSVLYTLFDLTVHHLFDEPCQKHYIDHKAFSDPVARKKRCYTLVKWGHSIIYYALSSVAAFLLLRNTSYFPTWLGGIGSPINIFKDFPENSEFTYEIEIFYILQLGKHFSRLMSHLFIKSQGNFYEYALHHGLSVFLILFSYAMDQWLIGTFVLLAHDLTDFFLIFSRGYKDFRNKSSSLLYFSYVVSVSNWIFWRVLIFGYAFVYCLWVGYFTDLPVVFQKNPFLQDTIALPIAFMGLMLLALQIMQYFWTYFIISSACSIIVTKELNAVSQSEAKTFGNTIDNPNRT